MESSGVTPELLVEKSEKVDKTFITDFNQLALNRRIVLLLDTTDRIEPQVWKLLSSLIRASKNSLFLLAGRNAKELWEALQSQLREDAKLILLQPFDLITSEEYLSKRRSC